MSYSVGWRLSLDSVLLWLWCRMAAAAPIGPLAWELPYATGAALKREKKKKEDIPVPPRQPVTFHLHLWPLHLPFSLLVASGMCPTSRTCT